VSLNCGLSDAKNISIAALFISIEKYHYLPKKVLLAEFYTQVLFKCS